jgi:uncharacterized repeat protein (TIGR01451 family)
MTVRAEFTFRNQGGAPATGVRVRFNVPEGLVYLVGSGRLDGAALDDEHGNSPLLARAGADIGDVAAGQERRIEIAYSVAGAIENGSTVEVQAAVAAFELPPVGSNIVRLVARSRPSLENALTAIAIESRQHEPRAGGEATISIRIHNAGESSAHDVVVVAPIPEHTTYVAHSARINGREFERELPATFDRTYAPVVVQTLPASATATLQYRVRIDDPLPDETVIAAHAQIASQETTAFALQPANLTVRSLADFEDDQTAFSIEPAQGAPGSRVTLHLHIHNAGTACAPEVTASLTLPEGLLPVRGSVRLDGHPLRERKNGALTFEIGPVPARQRVELLADAVIASPMADETELAARAKIRWNGSERELQRTVTVQSQPHLHPRRSRIERTGSATVRPFEECEATIFITNEGSAPASDCVLHLRVDPALEDLRLFEKNTALDLANDTVDLGTIEPYASRRLTARARVRSPYADRTELKLGASLHTQELGETALGEVTWRVDSHPAFSPQTSLLTLVQDDVFRPNQLVDVFVRLRNEGTDAAQNVRLRLYVSPEARLETVDGATRERSTLVFGEIPPGGAVEARLGVRLLRSLAKTHPVTIDAVLTADAMLPVQLPALTIVTMAEPNFAIGTLRSEPEEIVDAGEEVEFILHVRNSGDGPARRASITVPVSNTLIYVPNSTCVNDLPVRDVGALSPLMNERGLVMSDIDAGVEATIRWREVVNNAAASGDSVVRVARITYDAESTDEITAHELKVRCAPVFANTISGLPFGLDGMLGPTFAGHQQRAIAGSDFVELPPATPVARPEELGARTVLSLAPSSNGYTHTNGDAHAVETSGVVVVTAFDRDRLQRVMRFLGEARFNGLVTHLFAIRAFFPDALSGAPEAAQHEVAQHLRETLDRLFIKLRLPNYVIAPRDLENAASRAALQTLLGSVLAGQAPEPRAGSLVLSGTIDADELRLLRDRLAEAPQATALAWATLARLIPPDGDALVHYRGLLVAALDDLVSSDETAFVDALQRRSYPVIDAALDIVRAQLAHVSV